MKSILNYSFITLAFIFFSCNKESSDQILFDNVEKIGAIVDRGIEVPIAPKKCECWYEIINYQPILHDENRYVLRGEIDGNACDDCGFTAFRSDFICGDGVETPCSDLHTDPVPAGLFDFNCWLDWSSEFLVSFRLGCCPGDLDCINGPNVYEGKISYRIHCKRVGKVSNDASSLVGSYSCDQVFTSEIIKQHNEPFEWEDITSIELGGECGCEPKEIQ